MARDLREEIQQAKGIVRSLRNHTRTVTAYLADLEERLDSHLEHTPIATEAQGHDQDQQQSAVPAGR
jgi:hypothetical protein